MEGKEDIKLCICWISGRRGGGGGGECGGKLEHVIHVRAGCILTMVCIVTG